MCIKKGAARRLFSLLGKDLVANIRRMTRAAEAPAIYETPPTDAGMRVNARLDEATSQELRQLQKETGMSVTEVIRESIHRLYLQESVETRTPAESFADLIGCIDGPADLSSNYKGVLRDALLAKHG